MDAAKALANKNGWINNIYYINGVKRYHRKNGILIDLTTNKVVTAKWLGNYFYRDGKAVIYKDTKDSNKLKFISSKNLVTQIVGNELYNKGVKVAEKKNGKFYVSKNGKTDWNKLYNGTLATGRKFVDGVEKK